MKGENSIEDFKKGDKVIILIGEGDTAHFSMHESMRQVKGSVGTVKVVGSTVVSVAHPSFGGKAFSYAPAELSIVRDKPVIRGRDATHVVVDDPAVERIQSHDELVAENESLEKQIRKLEARVERKKAFQRQNVRKIVAWQVIME